MQKDVVNSSLPSGIGLIDSDSDRIRRTDSKKENYKMKNGRIREEEKSKSEAN